MRWPHIDVQSLEGAKQCGCSHCDVRYEIAPDHYATWLLQWSENENTTNAWLVCDAGLVHALRLIARYGSEGINGFLQAVKRGEGTTPVVSVPKPLELSQPPRREYEAPAIEESASFDPDVDDIDDLARRGSS